MTTDELYQVIEALIEAGDEAALQSFVLGHLTEFPEEDRNEFMLAFFSGVVDAEVAEGESRYQFIRDALGALVSLEEMRFYMKDAVAEDGVRARLARHGA